jgi:hypothetical protein
VQQFLASTNTTVILTLPNHRTSPSVIFPTPEDEIEAQGAKFLQHCRDPDCIAERDEDADAK